MTVLHARRNRQALDVTSLSEQEGSDVAYWLARTPAERFEALELLRQVHFGYDGASDRLLRAVEVVDGSREVNA